MRGAAEFDDDDSLWSFQHVFIIQRAQTRPKRFHEKLITIVHNLFVLNQYKTYLVSWVIFVPSLSLI